MTWYIFIFSAQKIEEVEGNDLYEIPGDHRGKIFSIFFKHIRLNYGILFFAFLGASGLDSSLYAHVKRNWLWVQSELNVWNRTGDSRSKVSEGSKKQGGKTPKPNEKTVKINTPVKRGTKRKRSNSEEKDDDINSGIIFQNIFCLFS